MRSCCIENSYATCASCEQLADVAECKKYNNLIAKLFGLVFRSDRRKCVLRIKEVGAEAFAKEMAETQRQTLPR